MPHRDHVGPTLAKATDDALASAPGGASESGMGVRIAPQKVLVADDDEDLRGMLRELFASKGYDVVEAADGDEALELLSSAADGGAVLPDVVLLDFIMPGFSGLGILRVMRRFMNMPPTIIMTGFPDPSVDAFARNLGAVCVLRKPLDAEALLALVLECAPILGRTDQALGA
jgi:CheY-like chemotaxis protein